jgi:hypothetical protein
MVGTGRMHRLIPVAALALAGGTQDRCRGKSLAMAPTTQRTIVVGRLDRVVTHREITNRDCHRPEGGGPHRGGDDGRAVAPALWPERVPWAGSTGRVQRTG